MSVDENYQSGGKGSNLHMKVTIYQSGMPASLLGKISIKMPTTEAKMESSYDWVSCFSEK